MITEDYVSYEIAKLLEEKGFDEPCECFYDTGNNDVSIVNGWMDISNSELEEREFVCYSAPTLQMTMKWLREVHKLYIEIGMSIDLIGKPHFNYSIVNKDGKYFREGCTSFEWEYEKACEAAIKYCLENLV